MSNIALATDFSDQVETADIDKSNETIPRHIAGMNSLSSSKLDKEEDDDYFVGHSRQKSVTVKEQRPNLRLRGMGMQGYDDSNKTHQVNNMFLKKAQTKAESNQSSRKNSVAQSLSDSSRNRRSG